MQGSWNTKVRDWREKIKAKGGRETWKARGETCISGFLSVDLIEVLFEIANDGRWNFAFFPLLNSQWECLPSEVWRRSTRIAAGHIAAVITISEERPGEDHCTLTLIAFPACHWSWQRDVLFALSGRQIITLMLLKVHFRNIHWYLWWVIHRSSNAEEHIPPKGGLLKNSFPGYIASHNDLVVTAC